MRAKNLRLKVSVCGVLAAAAISGSAFAQEKVTVLEEIVVTAQKRSESLQEVPISISAFTSKTRDLIGVNTVQDITNFTPGVTYQTSLDRMMVRGVGRLTNNLATDPGVATYVNGVFNSSNWSGALDPLFIERTEFLRGPQGTLYGRNSIGGAMNVVGKRPDHDWTAEVRGTYENYQRQVDAVRLSGPIADWLRFSLGGVSVDQDRGYFKNVNGGPGEGGVARDDYVEAQLSANIGSAVDLWAQYTHWDNNRSDRVTAFVNSSNTYDPALFSAASTSLVPAVTYCNPSATPPVPCGTPPVTSGIRNYAAATPDAITDPVDTYMFEAIAHLGFADLKYIGGYTNYRYFAISDTTGTAQTSTVYTPAVGTPFTIAGGDQFHYLENKRYSSNEVNLVSTGDGPLQWIAGLYQYQETYDQYFSFNDPLQPQMANQVLTGAGPFFLATGSAPNPGNEIYRNETWETGTSHAGFGQLDWKMSSTLKGTLGLRYTRDEKHAREELHAVELGDPAFIGIGFALPAGPASGPLTGTSLPYSVGQFLATPGTGYLNTAAYAGPCGGCFDRQLSGHWGSATGTAGLEWTPAEGTLGYFKFTRGYKSGGLNSGGIFANPYTNSEHINAFEVGLKQDVTKQLQVNTSVFFYKYLGAQAPLGVVGATNTITTIYVNLPDVHNYGGDISATWNATNQWQWLLTYGYLRSIIEAGCCYSDPIDPTATQPGAQPSGGGGGQSLNGQTMPGAPQNQGSVLTNYRFDFTPGSLTLVGSYSFRSEEYFSIFNRAYNRGGGYGTAGFRALWVDADDRYSLIAYVKNAFNKVAADNVAGALNSNDIAVGYTLIPPRTYGLQVQLRVGGAAK